MEEVPGGRGMVWGKAKTKIRAPMARSCRAVIKWPTEMRCRVSSAAIRLRISDSEGPMLRGSGCGRTRMPPAGECADDLVRAANAENSALLGQQHGVPGRLAQMNDGLQRERGGRHGDSGLEPAQIGLVLNMAKRVDDAVQAQAQGFVRGIERQ